MWDEVKGYVTLFIAIPLAIGFLYYGAHWMVTGKLPNPDRSDCYTDWGGASNPTVCD